MSTTKSRWFATIVASAVLAGCGEDAAIRSTEAAASLGCTEGTVVESVRHIDLEFGGEMRSYELHVPAGYDGSTPAPLLLNFHGFTSNGPQQEVFSNMNETADARGAIVAYPNGLGASWNGGACCGQSLADDVDDVGFARAVIDDLGSRACIDLRRVYATGMSNGGFMSHRLGCEAADVIAAIAPVAGVLGLDPADCNPSRPVPVVHFHGTADPLVSYGGGGLGDFVGVPETFSGWAQRNGCTGDPMESFSEGSARCETFERCDGDATVTLCTITDAGHCWPGELFCPDIGVDLGDSTEDISANETMWDLFDSVRLPTVAR